MRFVPVGTEVANVVVGAVAIILGIIGIVARRQIFEASRRFQRSVLGERANRAAASSQSPRWVGVAGALGLGMGAVMVTLGVLTLIFAP